MKYIIYIDNSIAIYFQDVEAQVTQITLLCYILLDVFTLKRYIKGRKREDILYSPYTANSKVAEVRYTVLNNKIVYIQTIFRLFRETHQSACRKMVFQGLASVAGFGPKTASCSLAKLLDRFFPPPSPRWSSGGIQPIPISRRHAFMPEYKVREEVP